MQCIFLNGNVENIEDIKSKIQDINPQIIIHVGKYIPLNLKDFNLEDNYLAFSGIGNHKTFISMIKNHGINVIKNIEFSDHHKFSDKDIDKVLSISEKLNCKIITTEKDYLRLKYMKINKIKYIKTDLHIIDEDKLINAIL